MNEPVKFMRLMAWERAKGELRSILSTYAGSVDGPNSGELFEAADREIEAFIKRVEDYGIGGLG